MKKKEKSNKENRITLKMLWSHPFYNSLIKLGMWFSRKKYIKFK